MVLNSLTHVVCSGMYDARMNVDLGSYAKLCVVILVGNVVFAFLSQLLGFVY